MKTPWVVAALTVAMVASAKVEAGGEAVTVAVPDSARLAGLRGGFESLRASYVPPRAPRRTAKFAARLGAALAWELADLPRHQARFPEPVGGFDAGPGFAAGTLSPPRADGSEAAIDILIRRWNTLYPPYALEGTNDH